MTEELVLWYQPVNRPDLGLACEPGFGGTFTNDRATAAWRVNPSGHIESVAAEGQRISYHPVTRACRGELIEGARTNVALQSEDFSTTPWSAVGAVLDSNVTTAPDGSTTADRINVAGGTWSRMSQVVTGLSTSGADYTVSVFVKADGATWCFLDIQLSGVTSNVFFDLTNETIGATPGADVLDSGIEDFGDGWKRIWIAVDNAGTDSSCSIRLAPAEYDGDIAPSAGSDLFCWGSQLEAGATLSSYIKTTTTSVTRNGDNTLLALAGELPTDAFTVYAKAQRDGAYDAATTLLYVDDGSTANRYYLITDTGADLNFHVETAVGNNAVITPAMTLADDASIQVAAGFAANDAALYTDATARGTDTDCAVLNAAPTRCWIGRNSGTTFWDGHIEEVRIYNYRKPNVRLIEESNESENGVCMGPYR